MLHDMGPCAISAWTPVLPQVHLVASGTHRGYASSAHMRALLATPQTAVSVHANQRPKRACAAGSFTCIFQPAMSLGLLSRRHVYGTALEREKRRGTGFTWAFASERSSADAKAAAAVAECGDYHTGLAHVMREQPTQVCCSTPVMRHKRAVRLTLSGVGCRSVVCTLRRRTAAGIYFCTCAVLALRHLSAHCGSSLSPAKQTQLFALMCSCALMQAGHAKRHFWRWNGQIVDYLVAEPAGLWQGQRPAGPPARPFCWCMALAPLRSIGGAMCPICRGVATGVRHNHGSAFVVLGQIWIGNATVILQRHTLHQRVWCSGGVMAACTALLQRMLALHNSQCVPQEHALLLLL